MKETWIRSVTNSGKCYSKCILQDENSRFEYLVFPGKYCHMDISTSRHVSMNEHLETRMGGMLRDALREKIESGSADGISEMGGETAKGTGSYRMLTCSPVRYYYRRANMDDVDCLTHHKFVVAVIRFDIIVRTDIEITDTDGSTDRMTMHYIVSGSCGMADNEEYYGWDSIKPYSFDYKPKADLDEYMVPIVASADREKVLRTCFQKYLPEQYGVMEILPSELAKRMGLWITERRLTHDGSILGRIVYDAGPAEVFDGEKYVREYVPSKTILIDPEAIHAKKGASEEDTIAHECIHYEKDRMYYMLQKRYARGHELLACPAVLTGDSSSPLYRIEKQTRQMAYLLRMPKEVTVGKIEELLEKYSFFAEQGRSDVQYERTVGELAATFSVSRQAAKYRMIELGYEQAKGSFNYVNGRYVPSYSFAPGKCSNNQTYTLSVEEALDVYMRSEKLRRILSGECFVYTEAHFCLNDEKYIRTGRNGKSQLTVYARTHIDECCLRFTENWQDNILNYDGGLYSRKRCVKKSIELTEQQEESLQKQMFEFEKVREEDSYIEQLPKKFPDLLVELMDDKKITLPFLSEKAQVSLSTIKRLRSSGTPASLQAAMGLCVGLDVPAKVGRYFISRAGYELHEMDDDEHKMYGFIIDHMHGESLDMCNRLLESYKCRPIGMRGENVS